MITGDGAYVGGLRVLLLDEHALRRAVLQRLLTALGEEERISVDVQATGSAKDASGRDVQVALIGSSTPENAPALLAACREALPDTPIVVLSDRETAAESILALEGGARGLISTCIEPALMLHALRFIAAGGHYFPPRALLDDFAEEQASPAPPIPANDTNAGPLTPRQFEVLRLLQEGFSNKRIARTLGLRESTIKVHVRHIMRKLGVENRTQAALSSMRVLANDLTDFTIPFDEPGEPRLAS